MRRAISILIVLCFAVLVATGCGEFGKSVDPAGNTAGGATNGESESDTKVTDKPFDAAEIKRAGCDKKVTENENKGREHVDGDVDYELNPPTSGNHNPVPLDWGIYTEQEPTEKWVHNLEHGHVVVNYKDISSKNYDTLKKHVKRDGYHIVLLPREANPKKGVYYNAWDAQLYCKKPSAPALQKMLNEYRDQGPELFMQDPGKKDDDE